MKLTVQRGLGLVVLAIVLFALVRAFLPKPVPVDLGMVTRGPLSVTVDDDGVTRIKERYVVSSPLAGRLRRVTLKPGAVVEAGRTLLTVIEPVDPQLLDPRTRSELEARAQAAEAAVQQAVANVERATAAGELATAELARARQLFDTGVLSQQELDVARTTERTASGELKAAQFATQVARFELEQARAALTQAGGKTSGHLDPFEIRAPVDGRVLRVWQESAAVVAPGTPLIEIGDPTELEVVIDVLSADGVRIQPGARIILEHWGGAEPLTARVRLVEPSAFLKISALGVEEQRVNVIGDLADPPDQRPTLGDAFRVEARIVVWESGNVLKVPTSALFRQGECWAVFAVENEHARLRLIELGHQNGLEGEVLDGLAEGDRVILHPGDQLEDGRAIIERTP